MSNNEVGLRTDQSFIICRGGAYLSPDEMTHLTKNWVPYRSLGGTLSNSFFRPPCIWLILLAILFSVLHVGRRRRIRLIRGRRVQDERWTASGCVIPVVHLEELRRSFI